MLWSRAFHNCVQARRCAQSHVLEAHVLKFICLVPLGVEVGGMANPGSCLATRTWGDAATSLRVYYIMSSKQGSM
jgi:hypothetical protein